MYCIAKKKKPFRHPVQKDFSPCTACSRSLLFLVKISRETVGRYLNNGPLDVDLLFHLKLCVICSQACILLFHCKIPLHFLPAK